jgi:uncharacterized phage protein gp47/JayE
MTTPDIIASNICTTIKTTLPAMDTSAGTPQRKLIDACAEAISEGYVAQYLTGSILDVDTKSGAELDQFVATFGFGRLQGQAAEGIVRVTLNTTSTSNTSIPLASQFYTTPGLAGIPNQLYYASTSSAVITAGNLSADIPVKCTTVGSAGNVPPGSITFLATSIGTATVTNLSAMTGGTDTETDQELRQRFKDTLMRNVTGTADFYEALCQQNNTVSRVVCFGPLSLYKTQIAVPSTELVLAVNEDVKYAWPQMESVFTDLGQTTETFYSPVDDYVYMGGTSPTFTTVSTGALASMVGQVVDLEFQYTTRSSRNDPLNGITNKVDLFTDGVNPTAITEQSVVSTTVLSSLSSSPFYTGNFRRVGSSGAPTAGNRFTRLGSTPITSFPTTLVVQGVVYSRGTHYFLLADTTLMAGTHLETSGIEWAAAGPPTGVELTLNYTYNNTPQLLTTLIAPAKQITTDVLVHQAAFVYLQPCFNVEYDRSYSVATVNAQIITRLQTYFASLPFGAQVKLATLCMFVLQTLGVVDCKITTSTDNPTNYGVQIFNNSSDPTPALVETADFKLADNQIGNYQGVIITRVAAP